MKILVLISGLMLCAAPVCSQAALEADGPGDTYELITSVLAPGGSPVEHPECIHPEFGRHIAEVWDADLNQFVFEFYSHVTPDNDRCINVDRQRIEIKTYNASPANLIGVVGETVTYKWKFKLPVGFQPSSKFTHVHQIKAVGGNDSDPIFTLTPRKGSPNKMELIHNNTDKVVIVNLSSLEGGWVECKEVVYIHPTNGTYSLTIKKVSDGTTLLSYANPAIMTIRSDNMFIRPKWGIYRSLLTPSDLRDEAMRFAGFYIGESTTTTLPVAPTSLAAVASSPSQIDLSWIDNSSNEESFRLERSLDGSTWAHRATLQPNATTHSDSGLAASTTFYYRVRAENTFGNSSFSNTMSATTPNPLPIQLASFTGTVLGAGTVRLDWMTISELNNFGFYVQIRRSGATQWEEISESFIAGNGTTNVPQHYSFLDTNPSAGRISYRLKQIDLDGIVHYTESIEVDVLTSAKETVPGEVSLKQNYPNPFNPSTAFEYGLPKEGLVSLQVFNLLGQHVATLVDGFHNAGTYRVLFDASGLSSGIYTYRINSGGFNDARRMLLVK